MAEAINIGSLDRKIVIQQYSTSTSSTSGEKKKTWDAFLAPWANVQMRGGDKQEEDQKITTIEDIVFTIRYVPGLNTKMRVLFDDKFYTIRSIDNIGRQRFTEVKADNRSATEVESITADMTTITVDSTNYSVDATVL